MNTPATSLPPGFESLEPFVAPWAVSGLADRARRRDESSPEERIAFYEAVKDVAGAALDHLDKKPLDQLDTQERRLLDLLLSFAHIALAVEIQSDAEPRHAQLRPAMRISAASV